MQTIPLKHLMVGAALVATSALGVGCGDDDGGGSGGTSGSGGMGAMDGGGTGGDSGTGGDTDAMVAGTGGSSGTGGTGGGEPCDPSVKEVDVEDDITTDTTWDCGTYLLKQIVYVTDGATLTIEPGVQVLGDYTIVPDISALIVARGSKLEAEGTEEEPIVFSSSAPVGSRAPAQWGGVVLLGSARINTGGCIGGDENNGCAGGFLQNNIEGLAPSDPNAAYGGTDDAHDCGTIRYARIEFAGFELAAGKELNGLTLGACGSNTTLSHIQVHRGSDDGIEFFGGTASMDHVVLSANSDDSLDWDLGWTGDVQFLVVHQATNDGDKGFEADNNTDVEDATPRSNPTIFNATMIGNPTKTGMLLREGTQGTLRNFLVQDFSIGVDLAAAQVNLATEWPTNLSIEDSCFHNVAEIGDSDPIVAPATTDDDMGFNETAAITDAARGNVTNVNPMLGSVSIEGPNYVPASTMLGGKATPPAGMDTTATYCGAFAQGGTDWTAGWTSFLAD